MEYEDMVEELEEYQRRLNSNAYRLKMVFVSEDNFHVLRKQMRLELMDRGIPPPPSLTRLRQLQHLISLFNRLMAHYEDFSGHAPYDYIENMNLTIQSASENEIESMYYRLEKLVNNKILAAQYCKANYQNDDRW